MKFKEGNLEFDFDEQAWSHVIKFDEHIDYAKVKNQVPETKGVDFTGILNDSTFVAIEVKDFRGFKTQENHREEPLEIEVAKKLVGSLATVYAGCRASTYNGFLWKEYNELIQNRENEVHIILWYEADPLDSRQTHLKGRRNNLKDKLKNKLSWLKCRVWVLNCNNYDSSKFRFTVR
jgi:hypothetical protein